MMQYPPTNNKKINISVRIIILKKHIHHIQEIHDIPLLIKILEITYAIIQNVPQVVVTICDAILEFIIIKNSIEISQL